MIYSNPIPVSPKRIQQIVVGMIAKASRRRRIQQGFHRLLLTNERKMLMTVNEWMAEMQKQLRVGLPRMRGKTAGVKARSMADWKAIKEEGMKIMKPALMAALTAGGESVFSKKLVRKQERFDPIGVEAIGWATEHSAEMVVEIADETMKAIRAYIAEGVDAGKSVPTIARELRPLVGLTEKQIMAVANYHEMLILERPEYTAARQREMAEVYARRLHRTRVTTIARTETAGALTEGQRQGYNQMGVKRLERVEDPDCCDICAEFNGKIYTISEAEGVLPEHPSCEGTWVAV